jgi:nucleotide-binding universal stress UspA family protein
MGQKVLIPVDESAHSQQACELAGELFPDGEMVLLHVINPAEAGFSSDATMSTFPEGWYEQQQDQAGSVLDDAAERLEATDVEQITTVGQPTQSIIDAIEEQHIDHVVMGSHGRQGVSRLLLGSVAENVVRRSPVPVTIAR